MHILRDETEWVETGWNRVVGVEDKKILEAIRAFEISEPSEPLANYYGDGKASYRILDLLIKASGG